MKVMAVIIWTVPKQQSAPSGNLSHEGELSP
jgi:hypothetical protein